ncbi:MAG TPA: isoprenylcysteine carboxylmethyltransferase family protein [Bryobacteraceae bacterium]|nr:isoprenylcysteine carboxylmethyltransferase family protein [Bryobacteraceae bacterium]
MAKRRVQAQSTGSRLLHSAFLVLAFLLLARGDLFFEGLSARLWQQSDAAGVAGLALAAAGAGFAIWARFYLGGNWSAAVTIKRDHTLIRTGPYAVVRHPIYAGFELGILGSAIALGEVRGFVAAVAALVGMVLKSRMEEEFMTKQFGAGYLQYKREVKALIPFVW